MLKNEQEIKIERYKIGFLVSVSNVLNLKKEVVSELLQTYYKALEIGKTNGFMDNEIIITDKPNLIAYLLNQELVEFTIPNDIDNKKMKSLNF